MLNRVENQPTLFQKINKTERLKSMERRYEEVLQRYKLVIFLNKIFFYYDKSNLFNGFLSE